MGKVQAHKKRTKAKRQESFNSQRVFSKKDCFEVDGLVEECLPNTTFKIKIQNCSLKPMIDKLVMGSLVGRMRLFRIRVMPGDKVKAYISKYDLNQCKIFYRSS